MNEQLKLESFKYGTDQHNINSVIDYVYSPIIKVYLSNKVIVDALDTECKYEGFSGSYSTPNTSLKMKLFTEMVYYSF